MVEMGVNFPLGDERELSEKEARFRARLLDAARQAVIALDLEGNVTYWNRVAQELYGWSKEEVMKGPSIKLIASEGWQEQGAEAVRELRAGGIWPGEILRPRKDGTALPVWATTSPVHDERGNLVGIVDVSIDMTKCKAMEEKLRASESKYRALIERIPLVTYTAAPDGLSSTLYISPQIYSLLSFSPDEFLAEPELFAKRLHPEDGERVLKEIQHSQVSGEPFRSEYRMLKRDQQVLWVYSEANVVRDEEGRTLYLQGFLQNITERKRAEEVLKYRSLHDVLTDLPNRRLFVDRLKQALRRTLRRGLKVAVLLMDLNDFKVINDSLGHEAGDRLLVGVSKRLRDCLRPEDTFARLGGDEFTVLVEEVEDPGDAVRVAERIIEEFRAPFDLEGRILSVSASIGIALGDALTKTAENLLQDADTAMYRAKEDHLDYQVFVPPMYERLLRRLEIEKDIRRAVEDEEFVVHFQPIVNLQTGGAWGFEALTRWNHPERGLLDPLEFVPIAEESGLMIPMGRWVLEEACRQGAGWQRCFTGTPPLTVSVNLSAKQLEHPDLLRNVEMILESTGLQAKCLGLDMTETAYARALEGSTTATLEKLRSWGIRLSLDDFGTGYLSLSYLSRLPADTLKIDKQFVDMLNKDSEDTAIVELMVNIAHTFGMKVVAEGVETEVQAKKLKEMGCDMAQGFYFAWPLPREDVQRLLGEQSQQD